VKEEQNIIASPKWIRSAEKQHIGSEDFKIQKNPGKITIASAIVVGESSFQI